MIYLLTISHLQFDKCIFFKPAFYLFLVKIPGFICLFVGYWIKKKKKKRQPWGFFSLLFLYMWKNSSGLQKLAFWHW